MGLVFANWRDDVWNYYNHENLQEPFTPFFLTYNYPVKFKLHSRSSQESNQIIIPTG